MQYDYSYDGKSVVKRRLEERTRWKEKLPDLKQWAKTQDLLCLYSLNQAYSPLPPKMYGKAAVNKVLPALAAVDQMSIPTSQKPIAVPNRSLYKIPLPLYVHPAPSSTQHVEMHHCIQTSSYKQRHLIYIYVHICFMSLFFLSIIA